MLNSDILYTAADNLERLTGSTLKIDFRPSSPDAGWDGTITIQKNTLSAKLKVEIKKDVHLSNLRVILDQLQQEKDGILIARYISVPGKKVFEENHINYLEVSGNCHIETSNGIFFHIKGEKQREDEKEAKHVAFNKNGIKLIYALLLEEQLINEPYRQMADMANISLSTVGGILKDLRKENYILQIDEEKKKLHNKNELLSHWITAFNQKLKPKLFRGRYRFGQDFPQNSWKGLDLGNFAFWGGEPAADYYTNFLYPEVWTIYTNLDKRSIIKDLQLRPDPNGMIEVYELFWKLESGLYVEANYKAVNPLLTYAELLGTKEGRNLEVAHRIYETYLKNIIE